MCACSSEAIRSVSHLVLAPYPKELFLFLLFSFIKSFFVFVFSFLSTYSERPSRHKARPENFQCRAAFIHCQRAMGRRKLFTPEVQAVFDSRHGRMACKGSLSRSDISGEPPPPITPKGSLSTLFTWLTAALKIQSGFMLLSLIPETFASGRSCIGPSLRAKRLWPICKPAL